MRLRVFQRPTENTDGSITVGYWTIRGLGAPLRAMVMYAGVPLNNVMYDCKPKEDGSFDASAWFTVKPELKAVNPLVNLPYVIDGDVVVSQTNACLAYLGRKLGLWGKTSQEVCACEQLLSELMDLRNSMTNFAYSATLPITADNTPVASVQGKNGVLQKLELWLERKVSKSPEAKNFGMFLVGDSATAPDFHLHELLVQYTALATFVNLPPFLAEYPRLAFFFENFEKLPGMQRYLQSVGALGALPFNQKMAKFGAMVTHEPWVAGTVYDFETYSKTY
jgi:glutathione S-transferase